MDFSKINEKRARATIRKEKRKEKSVAIWTKKSTKRRTSSRTSAFNLLKRLCKDIVIFRAMSANGGMCEIAMSCGGQQEATIWYHGWPQKGGNGLKYDVRSHFASCSACNMGEYGARMRGDDRYKIRHMELLGAELYSELDRLHGRRSISTAEARAMADAYQTQLLELKRKSSPAQNNRPGLSGLV